MAGLLVHDKYGDHVLEGEPALLAMELLKLRLNDGYWYDNWDDGDPDHQYEDRAKDIAQYGSPEKALAFLQERSEDDFEYEGIEVKTLR